MYFKEIVLYQKGVLKGSLTFIQHFKLVNSWFRKIDVTKRLFYGSGIIMVVKNLGQYFVATGHLTRAFVKLGQ